MHLVPASFDPQLIKGDILQYCRGLIASVENKHALIEQSFHCALLGDEDLKHHTLKPGRFQLLEKVFPERHSSTSWERALSGTIN